ncbi:MAG: B12-binding domain-containing radical SAM protein [Nitrospira sp.]|nr:B12-binding domain-containing radical SAM protein [Nitrospira sp.]
MTPSVLLVIPPLTQLNTPYPSTAYLMGFLRARGWRVRQADLGIEMALALFSRGGLSRVFEGVRAIGGAAPGEARQMLALEVAYLDTIDPVVAFLQGRDLSLAPRICQGQFLPQGPRFAARSRVPAASTTDQAKHLATLYLEDLADLVQATVAPQFALSRYAEHVGVSATRFDTVLEALAPPPSLTDNWMLEAFWRHVDSTAPTVVGLSVPFPGNLYGAFRVAQALKTKRPDVKIVLGGGYVNTELRRLSDPRVFDYCDYIMLDDGEWPWQCLLEHMSGTREEGDLKRTFVRTSGAVVVRNGTRDPDVTMAQAGTPTYDGLPLDRYLSILDTLNPMHRLWSDGHWNRLTVAHGCYWKQCTFCDVGLDYIGRYEAAPSAILVDRIEALIAETGRRGFHFVDEAAPPHGLKDLALALLERHVTISWWGNIRFEEAFTPDLCRLLAASGCVAVSAGLEAASDRLLAEMKKGITVDQTARVAQGFRQAGILVHAYLMYGLPGETIAETVDALERVRQLFAAGLIQSAFWHKFVATAHSPVGLNPAAHGIRITGPSFSGFAENDLMHEDPKGQAPAWLGEGLRRATMNYLEGEGLALPVRHWFSHRVSSPRLPKRWVAGVLAQPLDREDHAVERRLVWTGGESVVESAGRGRSRVILPTRADDVTLELPSQQAVWLGDLLRACTPKSGTRYPVWKDVMAAKHGTAFAKSGGWKKVRTAGLLLV